MEGVDDKIPAESVSAGSVALCDSFMMLTLNESFRAA
jgi:hypothetical protein